MAKLSEIIDKQSTEVKDLNVDLGYVFIMYILCTFAEIWCFDI